ncbi:hypothetical protein Gogos_006084 [Gossypium gossypioides]|uniref:Uncharacterized protein n=1 Tax=Gossypium gossypioides TaxID=34282 RepID=A0A7J9C4J5_GOSGO|nr:hypothetical protein [Gossypium gossypioides]
MPTPGSSFTHQDNVALENEMNTKHAEQIQTIQAEQAVQEKALLEEAESRFHTKTAE